MKLKPCGVYKITNIINGNFYIGSADNITLRLRQHRQRLASGTHCNRHLQNAWNKYGDQVFKFATVLLCDIENKLYYEQVLIDSLKPVYNIAICAAASMQGLHHTEETKRKISERIVSAETRTKLSEWQKGSLSYNFGKHRPEETKRKISAAAMGNTRTLGYKHTEAELIKMSEWQKGRHLSEETRHRISETNMGHFVSEETLAKMSQSQKGRHHSEETKHKMSEAKMANTTWVGRKHTEETKAKMSVAQKRRRGTTC